MKLPSLKIDIDSLLASHKATACKHPKGELRKHVDGTIFQIKEQCITCGALIGKVRKKAEFTQSQIDSFPEWDPEMKDAYWKVREAQYDSIKNKTENDLLSEWRRQYSVYLDCDEWKAKRKKVLDRAEYVCEGCRINDAEEIHHTTYKHVGEEFLFELVALCPTCHTRYHADTFPLQPEPSHLQSEKKKG